MVDDNQQQAYADQIAQVIHDFMQLMMRFRTSLPKELAQLQNRLDEIHPSVGAYSHANYDLFYRISHNLYRKSNLTMGELSSALSVPLSTATRMIDWLVHNGYAQRLPDLEDRRIVRVALTDSGRELHKTIGSFIEQRLRQILSGLTAKERTTLLALMGKIVSAPEGIER